MVMTWAEVCQATGLLLLMLMLQAQFLAETYHAQ
jgi:hypothetical protein